MSRRTIVSDQDGVPLISIGSGEPLSTPEVLAEVAMAQIERLERLGDDDAGDPRTPEWWFALAREADDLATSARAVAISLQAAKHA